MISVVPLTSRTHEEAGQVLIRPPEGGLTNDSVTLPDQIRAVDRQRLVWIMGALQASTMRQISDSIKTVLGLT